MISTFIICLAKDYMRTIVKTYINAVAITVFIIIIIIIVAIYIFFFTHNTYSPIHTQYTIY